ncbi:hypothetical protein Bca4012_086726 [Brassica carinata]|uniref:(rape) hypothetical protein n=1 Tax=Brassica napus TaxID=3708 RepID=A0A816R173_BRANA|nr:hypothetical protein HID58_040443 [Brassica napus]CAF2068209.1 unnamed protein product [Brassica napus]
MFSRVKHALAFSKIYGYCYIAAFGGAGFLLGGVTTSPVSKGLRENEKVSNVWKKWRPGEGSGLPLLKRKQSDALGASTAAPSLQETWGYRDHLEH